MARTLPYTDRSTQPYIQAYMHQVKQNSENVHSPARVGGISTAVAFTAIDLLPALIPL